MKNDLLILTEKTKEELIDEILRLRQENEKLRQTLETNEKNQAHKEFLKNLRLAQRMKHPKTPGQKIGHEGLTRIKPNQIDHVVESKLRSCPDCHPTLSNSQEVLEHIQEDIIPAHREVTCFKKHRYGCRGCEKIVTAPYAPEEVPHGYLGPNILVQTVYERRIKRLEKRLFLWSCRDHKNTNLLRLPKRFLKHGLHLLTFLKEPGISSNNNLAERMIRPHVIIRNRSDQNQSEKGAKAHEVLMSLLHTCTLQKKDTILFFKEAFLKHRQGFYIPRLALS